LYTKSGLLFSGNDGNGGFEPRISDGSSAGTHGIVDINLAGNSNPQFYFVWNGDVYLSADDGNSDEELFDLYKLQGPYSPLPVKLGTLTATAVQQSVQLSWNTFTEINSASFEVQRSTDGSHFSKIGSVMAAGNSATEKKYSYTDLTAFEQNSATLYYRLNTIDKDGQQAYSKVVKVIVSPGKIELSVYPNPAQDALYISHKTAASSLFQILDMNGKVVYNGKTASAGHERTKINVSNLSAGTYIIRMESDNKISSVKFVKN
jgi:ELWxxDGT repeat protein